LIRATHIHHWQENTKGNMIFEWILIGNVAHAKFPDQNQAKPGMNSMNAIELIDNAAELS